MPNIVPGVVWQPVDVGNRAARRKGRGLCGHVAVSSAKDLVPGPLATRSADWHLYLPKSGPAIQYIDLDLQCWATAAGNATMVAFESEGGLGTAAQVNAEPWTDNQLTWAARILRHLHDTEGVPLQVMNDSLPGSRGFGTHRLGIDPWRVAGGEVWSSARGKLCPGDAKHAQRAEIVRRATELGEDDMPSAEEVATAVWAHNIAQAEGIGPAQASQWLQHGAVMATRASVSGADVHGKVVDSKFDLVGRPGPDTDDLLGQVLSLRAEIRDLAKAVAGLVGGAGPVDVKAVADLLTVVPKS